MPKGSEELTNARKDEIINACASLYKTMGFKDITIRDIGAETSFTRTAIYNYFQTTVPASCPAACDAFRQKKKFFWHCCKESMKHGSPIWRR